MRVRLAVITFSILLISSSLGLGQAQAATTVQLRDLGVLQLAAHDLFDVDRTIEKNFENGLLDLSTLLKNMRGDKSPFPDSQILMGGELPRNAENIMIFTIASTLGQHFVDAKNTCINGGGSPDACFQSARNQVLAEYYSLLDDAYMRAFGEPRPQVAIEGCATPTENLALRTIHDLLPEFIEFNGVSTFIFDAALLFGATLSDSELDNQSSELDGVFDPAFATDTLIVPIGITLNLFEKDSTFASQFNTQFTFEELLLELQDGSYDPNDKAMNLIRSLFAKGLGTGCYVGGEDIPIDSVTLVLAGAQSSMIWFVPLILAGAGLAAFRFRRF